MTPRPAPGAMPIYLSVQYLRAAASLAVVLFHASMRGEVGVSVLQAGVDVFFVVSGFIMWTVSAARPTTPGRFIVQRLVRVAPAYWCVTAFMVLGGVFAPFAFPRLLVPADHVVLSLLFVPHTDPYGLTFPVVIPGWTLVFEMFFYALVAAALPLPRAARAGVLLAGLVGLVAAGRLALPANPVLATYSSPLLLEFAAGLALGVAATAGVLPGRWASAGLLLGGLVLFTALGLQQTPESFWFDPATGLPAPMRAILAGVPAACLVAGAVGWERACGVKRHPVLLALGDSSYALYLTHAFFISVVWRLLPGQPVAVLLPAAVLGGVAAGFGFHWLVEQPLTRALRRVGRAGGSLSPGGPQGRARMAAATGHIAPHAEHESVF